MLLVVCYNKNHALLRELPEISKNARSRRIPKCPIRNKTGHQQVVHIFPLPHCEHIIIRSTWNNYWAQIVHSESAYPVTLQHHWFSTGQASQSLLKTQRHTQIRNDISTFADPPVPLRFLLHLLLSNERLLVLLIISNFHHSFATPCNMLLYWQTRSDEILWLLSSLLHLLLSKWENSGVTKTMVCSDFQLFICNAMQHVALPTNAFFRSHLQKVLSPTKQDYLNCVSSSLTVWTLPSYSRKPGLFGLVVSDPREAWQSVSTISRLKLELHKHFPNTTKTIWTFGE